MWSIYIYLVSSTFHNHYILMCYDNVFVFFLQQETVYAGFAFDEDTKPLGG